MKNIQVLFGNRIKELRKGAGFSQDKLAEKINISSKYLSRIEVGEHFPSLEVLVKLADSLGVELKDLFEFYHEAQNQRELKENLSALLKEIDTEKLRMILKVVRAILK